MGMGLVVGVWVARYLGPERFGQFNYAAAFVALFGTVAAMGLNSIVIRDLVKDTKSADETLGSAFALQVLGGLFVIPIMFGATSALQMDDEAQKIMIAIMGCSLVFKASEIVKCWFDSLVMSRLTVIGENAAFLIISAVKIALIVFQAPLVAFAWLFLAESILTAAILLLIYTRSTGRLLHWKPSFERMAALIRDSWPLFLSGLAVMVYMRIDQIMLGQMIGSDAVGIYSAATRISEVWYFIPSAIVASVYPSIIEAKRQSEARYLAHLQRLFSLMILLAMIVAVPATLLSTHLVTMFYGSAYASAGTILAIHIWTAPFVFLGVASNTWYVTENLQHLALFRTLLGAVMNVLANYLLIPRYGAMGAAIGTLIAQASAAYLFDAFNRKTRHIFKLKSRAFLQAGYKTQPEPK